ncbi:MAG: BatA domain-containing protein [Planctomycetia bacterium]
MGLSFLTPMLLAGTALVVVPVVLHMIMRRKPVKHDFPALRFLRERAVANRRRLRLNHLLLLLVRMAALVLLAFALARPTLRGAGWLADAEGPVAAVFVFDTAPRMQLREANRSRLVQAAEMARVLVGKLPPTSKVAVVDTTGGPAAFSPTIAAATARVERLAGGTPGTTLAGAMAEGLRLLESVQLARREMYVFTDCSRGAWANATPLDLAASHPDVSVLYVDVGARTVRNFAIESVELASDVIAAGTPVTLTVSAGHSGPDANRAIAVEMLSGDGGYVRRAIKPVAWKDGATTQVSFDVAGLEPGVRQGRVVIDGTDDLEADDARSFTVEVGRPARVLVAAPVPSDRTGRFVAQAIAPVALAKAGKARFDVAVVDVTHLDAAPWDGVAGIVLVDPPPLPARTWDLLGQWVAAGHGLVVWLGPEAGDAGRFNSDASRRVLGGGIVRVWRSPDGGNFLAPAALEHPVLAAFRRVGDAVPWQDFPVERHWEFASSADGPDDGGAMPVAAYRNGLAAILEHRVGAGMVITVTTPVSQAASDPEAWNTLATGFEPWPFVMLANETLRHAVDTADDRNIVAGRPAVLHVDRRDVPAAFVRTPAGDDFPAVIDQARGTITVTATQLPGNYVVRAGGEAGGFMKGFSANLDAAATDTVRLDDELLHAVLGPAARIARTEQELVRDVNLERVGAELSGWLLLLAAAMIAVDWMLANRFYAPRGEPAAAGATTKDFAAPPPLPAAAEATA